MYYVHLGVSPQHPGEPVVAVDSAQIGRPPVQPVSGCTRRTSERRVGGSHCVHRLSRHLASYAVQSGRSERESLKEKVCCYSDINEHMETKTIMNERR